MPRFAPSTTLLALLPLACAATEEPPAGADTGSPTTSGSTAHAEGTSAAPEDGTTDTGHASTRGEGAAESSETGAGSSDTDARPTGCDPGPSIVGVTNDGEYNYATAFPIALSFDDDAYATTAPIVWIGSGATHEHVPDGGIDGCGAARIHPPSEAEHMAGIGQILGLRAVTDTPRLSIRYCISVGETFPDLASGAKPIILWRADPDTDGQGHDDAVGARPMVISRPDTMGRGVSYGLCDGTVCTYHGGDFWPDGSDTWLLDAGGWSCLEFEFDLQADTMRLFVSTDDGRFHDTPYFEASFRDENSGPGGVFAAIDTIGGYFAQSASDPDNYYDIDALVIDTQHIGPPAGFGG